MFSSTISLPLFKITGNEQAISAWRKSCFSGTRHATGDYIIDLQDSSILFQQRNSCLARISTGTAIFLFSHNFPFDGTAALKKTETLYK
jgi:hypothetical protein